MYKDSIRNGTEVLPTGDGTKLFTMVSFEYEMLETYLISYDLDGGSVTSNPANYTKVDTITLNNPTKKGYNFLGWTGSNGSIPQKTITIEKLSEGNKNYTANWTRITYTITYNCNGGEGSMSSSVLIYDESKNLTLSKCYKITTGASGAVYKILGWSTSPSDGTIEYSDGQSVNNLTTIDGTQLNLYAVWDNNSIFTYNGSYNVLNDGNGNWRVKFLSGGTYTSKTQILIDTFLVGGGGGGVYVLGMSGGGGGAGVSWSGGVGGSGIIVIRNAR